MQKREAAGHLGFGETKVILYSLNVDKYSYVCAYFVFISHPSKAFMTEKYLQNKTDRRLMAGNAKFHSLTTVKNAKSCTVPLEVANKMGENVESLWVNEPQRDRSCALHNT